MTFTHLLSDSVRIFLKTRLIWLFAAFYLVYAAITVLMPSSTNTVDPQASLRLLPLICGLECLMLLFVPVLLFGSCGTSYAGARVWSGQPVTLRDTWERFKQRLLALSLLTLALIAVVIVLVVILMIILVGATLVSGLNSSATQGVTILVMTVVIMPLSLIVGLGYVALMLDPQGGFDALTRGAKIYWRKIGTVLLSFVVYFITFAAIQIIFSLLFYAVFDPVTFRSLPTIGFEGQFIRLLGSTPTRLLNIILMPLVAPIYFILLALIYQDAAGVQRAETQEPAVLPA